METLSDLKKLFYQEHARDRRLTLINYFLILCAIGAFIWFLHLLGVNFRELLLSLINQGGDDSSSDSMLGLYPKIASIVVFVCILGYPFYLLWKISKRPQKIEDLISRAERGEKLTTVHDSVEYKITIPVLKVNFKLCPVTFVQIYLSQDTKPYTLPIRNAYITDMKLLLSGVDVTEVNQHKAELYGDAATGSSTSIAAENENVVSTPLKSVEEFRAFIDAELKDDINTLESSRKSIRKIMVIGVIISSIVIVAVMGFVLYKAFSTGGSFNPMTSVVPIFVLGFVITIIFNIIAKKKAANTPIDESQTFGTTSFKEKIISRMVNFINPSVKYIPMAHLSLVDIFESGLFQERNYTVDGSDQISGKHNGVPFISCDLSLQFKKNFSEEKELPDCVFFGQFFVARFNKAFSTPVYIVPNKNKYSTLSYLTGDKGESVKLEDPEFMRMFSVYAKDQLESRYILTPSLMERIKELAKKVQGEFYIAFYNNKITVANNSGINNFEASFSKSITDKNNELLVGFYTDMCDQFAVIDELKLNINIWKK